MKIHLIERTGDPASRFCQAMLESPDDVAEPCLEPVAGRIAKITYPGRESPELFSVCDRCFFKITEAMETK